MSDPFNTRVRRYIPWPEYRVLEDSQAAASLIGHVTIEPSDIEARLASLRHYETSLGFVYFGERRWLEDRFNSGTDKTYAVWAAGELERAVFPGGFVREEDPMHGSCWRGESNDPRLFWTVPELSSPIGLYCVVVLIRNADEEPPHFEAGRVFEVLHDLAYHLHNAGRTRTFADAGDVGLDTLVFSPQQSRWEMFLGNEWGSIGAFDFDGREVVGFS